MDGTAPDEGYFSTAAPSGDRIAVLHVDDEAGVTETAAAFLAREDDRLDVTTAASPADALDALDGIDCVVSDYDMPGMDGLELLERVRERRPELPFVLFTGKGSEEIASEAISAGVSDYLRKGAAAERYELLANRIVNAVEQYRAREAASLTERRLRELTERTDDVLWTFTADWSRLLFVNDAYESVYGGDIAALSEDASAFLDTIHPDDRETVVAAMERIAGGEAMELEYRVDPRSGYDRWVWVQGEPVREDGEVVRVVGYSREVTDRKHRKDAVEALHAATRELMTAESRDEIASLTVETVEEVLGLPYAVCRFHDEEADALRAAAFTEGVTELSGEPPTYRAGDSLTWRAFEAGESRFYDDVAAEPDRYSEEPVVRSELICPLGEFGVLTVGSPEPGAFDSIDGSLLRVLAANAEAALRRADREAEVRAERRFFDQAMAALDDVFYVLDTDGRLRRWNRNTVEVTGYDPDELDGMDAFDLFPDDQRERVAETIERVLTEGSATLDAELLDADGERHPYEFTGSRLTDPDGELFGVVGIGRDVSERRERERALERQNDRLERFADIVSHDLRSPLAVARGRLELGRETGDDEHLAAVGRAHDRMESLVDDLLELAREGDRAMEPEPVALADVVEACWRNVETDGAALRVGTEATIRADPGRLRQLLENLLRNAVEHGDHGVTVTVGDLPDGFYLADDGPGIPEAERDRVFETGHTTADDGTGLGLAIVRETAEAHGWRLTVTESDGGGARFEFRGVEAE
ncbi:PAS domain S-box protein [Halosegnis marinus]|uniref:histidine kinase n=1 Tax=Halosegnis marinus TaxID=3034023 RepID=A0ABD5ZLU5_9EURY|nr:PAS domain S-box protein [Halosegnis sp. DT85]